MKKISKYTAFLLMVSLLILSFSGCMKSYKVGGKKMAELEDSEFRTYTPMYSSTVTMLSQGTPEDLLALSYSTTDFSEAWDAWASICDTYGAYQDYEAQKGYAYGDEYVLQGELTMEKGSVMMDIMLDKKTKLVGIEFYQRPTDEEAIASVLPETLEEKTITLGEGTSYPLEGVITMPKGAQENGVQYPAVILLHGTGANDRDHTAGNTHMFRDLAWNLAQQGIVVIRYDKRTNQYGKLWTTNPTEENLSVEWEIVQDALEATELLRSEAYVDPEQVYVVGHSLGAEVSSRVDAEGGDYAGFVLLSAPSRPWYEAAYDQYLNYGLASADMDSDDLYYTCSILDSQKEDIVGKLDSYSDSELLTSSLLGMPAMYWKNMNDFDYIAAFEASSKPILILQGDEDYQIVKDKDFSGWEKIMEGHSNVTLKSYEGLNHLMMVSQGFFKGNAMEYSMPNHVDPQVIEDITSFIVK